MHRGLLAGLLLALLVQPLPLQAARDRDPGSEWCGKTRTGARDAVWRHRERAGREAPVRAAGEVRASEDVGSIAVLRDEGDLVFLKNLLDLQGAGLEFDPEGPGYSVARVDRPVSAEGGDRLALGDDDSRAVSLSFPFPLYGQVYRRVFVNSDGNLTFGEGDSASTDRNLGRMLAGPPRVAPLLADLDPSAGGTVTMSDAGDRLVVTWTNVPQFDKQDKNTFQVTLHASGRIDFAYDKGVSAAIAQGVVGVAPGRGENGFVPVDFSKASGAGKGALVESFQDSDTLDTVAAARKFYLTHADDYQQLVVFTDRRLAGSSTFSYEQTIQNAVTGIGVDRFDVAAEYGSGGRLESFVLMDDIGKYPEDLNLVFLGGESALSIMGQEVGHRWLAQAVFQDGSSVSRELLGRDEVHWSFFMDTDGSHLEGNTIQDLGGGRFLTAETGVRYCPLDQYLMGVRPPDEVPPFFFVRNPQGTGTSRGRAPQSGVGFSGTRRSVTIDEVVAAMGTRNPPASDPPAPWRQTFVFVAVDDPGKGGALDKIERFRRAWEPFFASSTGGRWSASTSLRSEGPFHLGPQGELGERPVAAR